MASQYTVSSNLRSRKNGASVLNLGILAHVDAGKTTLTERLLFEAGAIDVMGKVDDGNTTTDSMELERRRGITIKSAVATFRLNDIDVNLIDTPGHRDFVAEVERALSVLDGAVLVISAVEGVQAQTRILFRALKRLKIPMLIFVNKIDRLGARYDDLLDEIATFLSDAIVPMTLVKNIGARDAETQQLGLDDPTLRMQLAERLADNNEDALEAFVRGQWDITNEDLAALVASELGENRLHLVYFGSAALSLGIQGFLSAIERFLPRPPDRPDAELAAIIFKIERGKRDERIAYIRVFDGTMKLRHSYKRGEKETGKVTALEIFQGGGTAPVQEIGSGRIAKVWGLGDVQIGEEIGEPQERDRQNFTPPTLETLIMPHDKTERGALLSALTQLAEQDPFISVRQDDLRQEVFISLFGEIQKEVIQDILLNSYGLRTEFRQTTPICIERVMGVGHTLEVLQVAPNPFLSTIGLRVEPRALGQGNYFTYETELGAIPLSFQKAVEDTVYETLSQGLKGWKVEDCLVTMTDTGYLARQSHSYSAFDKSMSSTARDFRQHTPLVLTSALAKAGTQVCQPIHKFNLEVPGDVVAKIFPLLKMFDAVVQGHLTKGQTSLIEGSIPSANAHGLQMRIPHLTRGESALEFEFERYDPVVNNPPSRSRTDNNPLNRLIYLRKLGIPVA